MDITCKHCHSTLKIPEEKLPKSQAIMLTCPKCKNKIVINPGPGKSGEATSNSPSGSSMNGVSNGEYNVDDKPFDFLEEGTQTALVCEDNNKTRGKISSTLKKMNYHITEVTSQREALAKMRFHVYNLIILNESFENSSPENNHILRHLNSLNMVTRRNIFVALVGNDFRTMDNMTAFARSVNTVINSQDLNQLETVMKKSLSDHERFYRVFRTALQTTGRR